MGLMPALTPSLPAACPDPLPALLPAQTPSLPRPALPCRRYREAQLRDLLLMRACQKSAFLLVKYGIAAKILNQGVQGDWVSEIKGAG